MRLWETSLFNGMQEEEVTSLLQCLEAVTRHYKRGEVIFPEGRATEYIGVVLSGMVMVSCTDIWGNNSILGSAAPGAVFAEAYACIPGEPLLISASAAEDSEILFIHVGKVLSTCSNTCVFHGKLIRNLLTVCAEKSLQLSRRILHTSSKSIRGRLLSYFSECAKKSGSYSFEIPYNRQQLADYLSVDRSAMSSELSKMQKDGLIRYQKNHFQLLETK
ncbi:MAG: Crp/Fnr family transcriptional regulator [Lachnospiraceae bacterium]